MIVNTGSIGEVGYSQEPFWCSDGCFCLEHTDEVLSKFLYYYLVGFSDYLISKIRVGGVPTIDKDAVSCVKVPIPPLEVQYETVKVLDNFNSLCTDITSGIPAEIAARQKQYEYYRDLLLTFDRKEAT